MRPGRLLVIIVLVATPLVLLWRFSDGDVDPVESARESLRAAEAEHGIGSIEVASKLDALVEALYGAGRATSPETLEHARRAVEIREARAGLDELELAGSLGNLAAVLHARGDFAGAIDTVTRSLEILKARDSVDPVPVWEALNNLAYFSKEAGDFAAARGYFDEAIARLESSTGDFGAQLAFTWNNYALLLHESGDYPRARELFEKAREQREGTDPAELANVLNSLGRLLHDQGEHALARERFERALRLHEELDPPLPHRKAMVLNNLGYLVHDLGDLDTALELYGAALELREQVLGPDHPNVAWTLGNLGLLRFERGDIEQADQLFRRALDIRTRALGRRHRLVFQSLTYLAALRFQQGALSEALELALEAEEIRRHGMLLEVRVLAERQALLRRSLDVFKLNATSLDVELSVLVLSAGRPAGVEADSVAKVWDDVIRSRGLVLDELARRHRSVVATDDPELKRLFEEVHAARQRMANLWVRSGPGELFRRAEKEKERAEEALARAGWDQRDHADGEKSGWSELSASLRRLPAGSLVVAYVRYGQVVAERVARGAPVASYLAFVHRVGDERPTIVPIGPASEIDPLVERWRASIVRGVLALAGDGRVELEAHRGISAELRARIWDPVVAGRDDGQPVFLVPDGALHRVSFAGLAVGDDGYLVERGPIHYLTAERDLPHFVAESAGELSTRGAGLLALARPRFEPAAQDGSANALLSSFEDLPATEDEVKEILEVVRRASSESGAPGQTAPLVLVGDAANESSFKRLAPGRRYLHLATHGFYLDAGQIQERTEVKVRGLGAATSVSTRAVPDDENPLLLSGIALSGANRGAPGSPEDGILTAEEVVSMDLAGVDWAVLSACKTGDGAIRTGEGIFGLRRAFQIAGAKTLISSLWPVEDNATRQWMVALYRARFESGLGTAEAVRRAALAVLAAGRRDGATEHPFFWAAFLAAGDWR